MADVVFTDKDFEEKAIKSDKPVVVDFWAPWCGPCRMVSPVIEELAKEFEGKVVVGKLNVDENPETASEFNVMSIPMVMVFKRGKVVKSFIGVQRKETYKAAIEDSLK